MSGLMRSLLGRRLSAGPGPGPGGPEAGAAEATGGGAREAEALGLEGLRLVVFRDAWEWGERRLLFDSAAIRQRPSSESSDGSSASDLPSSPRPASHSPDMMREKRREQKQLGEMIFGTVPLAFKGHSVKLHKYRKGSELVLSKVFGSRRKSSLAGPPGLPPSIKENGCGMEYSSDSDSQYSTVNSLSGLVGLGPASSGPMDVPERLFRSPAGSLGAASPSPTSGAGSEGTVGPGPGRSASAATLSAMSASSSETLSVVGSPMSRSLRLRSAQTFSLDQGLRRKSVCQDDGAEPARAAPRPGGRERGKAQLGLALLIAQPSGPSGPWPLGSWRGFVLTHMGEVEAEVGLVQAAVQTAHAQRHNFYGTVQAAWARLRERLGQLFLGQRLPEPVWASLRRYQEQGHLHAAHDLRQRFLRSFLRLARHTDTKERHFFLSNLVTGVLMEHGTWVGSVGPAAAAKPFLRQLAAQTRLRHASGTAPSPPPTPEMSIARQGSASSASSASSQPSAHLPYNPLAAQHSELRGRIGDGPSSHASVLVTGPDQDLVGDLLFVLSYFVRSSDVRQALAPAALPSTAQLADSLFTPASASLPPLPSPSPPRRPDSLGVQRKKAAMDRLSPPAEAPRTQPPSSPEKRRRPVSEDVSPQARPRSDSLLGLRQSLEATEVADRDDQQPQPAPQPAPSVIQINQRRFEVTSVPDSAISAPTGGVINNLNSRSHFRRPGSPRKRQQRRTGGAASVEVADQSLPEPIHPSTSQPQVWTDPLPPLLCEPIDLETNPKLRKLSAGLLRNIAPGLLEEQRRARGCQLSPGVGGASTSRGPLGPSSDGESGGCSSGEERPSADARPPRSLDSGIAESDALNLMELSGRQPKTPPSALTTPQPSPAAPASSVFGAEVELEEFSAGPSVSRQPTPPLEEGEGPSLGPSADPSAALGHSLFGGYQPSYSPHFALSGCPHRADLIPSVLEELGSRGDGSLGGEGGEEPERSVVVVGSTTDWSVRLVSARLGVRPAAVPSQIVLRGVESVAALAELGASPEFLLRSLEDCLGEVWRKSLALAGALAGAEAEAGAKAEARGREEGQWLEMEELVRLAGVDWADLPLLFSVAGLHSHKLLASLSA